jgi:predicted phosphodiesterase
MKYALLSDIHGNVEAFQAVLGNLEREKVDQVFFLGDIVGYGANPEECIKLLEGLTTWVVAGNHDWASVGLTDYSNFNPVAKTAIEWTKRKLSVPYQHYLTHLPLLLTCHNLTFVHASPYHPEEWNYVFSLSEASFNFCCYEQQISFIGHSHTPVSFMQSERGTTHLLQKSTFPIEESSRYLINVGSVGQPRDGDPRAAYAIYDLDESRVTIKRIAYDIEGAQKKIIEAGLPHFLAQRLAAGT